MSQMTRGQQNRYAVLREMLLSLEKYQGQHRGRVINRLSYEFNLSPYAVEYYYLNVFADMDFIGFDSHNNLVLHSENRPDEVPPDDRILTLEEKAPEYVKAKRKLQAEKLAEADRG